MKNAKAFFIRGVCRVPSVAALTLLHSQSHAKGVPTGKPRCFITLCVMKLTDYIVDIWVINQNGTLLVTLRAPEKIIFPDLWENTAGNVLSGESSKEAARRELFEETGILVSEERLKFIGSQRGDTFFIDSYLLFVDTHEIDLTLQAKETVAAKWVSLAELEGMISDNLFVPSLAIRLSLYRKEIERLIDAQCRKESVL